jgi:hypothetical protein
VPSDGQAVTLPSGDVVKYEAASKLFVVEGRANTVLFDGRFWEKKEDLWLTSPNATGGYAEVAANAVPAPVRLKYRKPALIGDKPKAPKEGAAGKAPKQGAKAPTGGAAKKKTTGDTVE